MRHAIALVLVLFGCGALAQPSPNLLGNTYRYEDTSAGKHAFIYFAKDGRIILGGLGKGKIGVIYGQGAEVCSDGIIKRKTDRSVTRQCGTYHWSGNELVLRSTSRSQLWYSGKGNRPFVSESQSTGRYTFTGETCAGSSSDLYKDETGVQDTQTYTITSCRFVPGRAF